MPAPDPFESFDKPTEQIYDAFPIPEPEELLSKDHTLNGGILFGLDGYIVEIQARAMRVFDDSSPWRALTKISGMARGAINEAMDRISGSFAKIGCMETEVEILVNLVLL